MNTDRLWERALRLFPGGVNSPVRAYRAVGGDPPVIVSGRGAHVWDADGRRYLDLIGAFGPLVLGHAAPAVVAALAAALERGGPFGATTEAEITLAESITGRMPVVERLRFVNSGTEAAMSALRLARAATGRDLVLKFEGGYHGHSDSMLVRAGSGLATFGTPDSAGVPDAVARLTLVAKYNDLQGAEDLLAAHPGAVAAVIVEPVAANVGVVPPAPGFLSGLRELTRREGALLVFDEVITGFRVSPGGATELYGVQPDLVVLGKIIGGGLPVGAFGGRADLMDLVAPQGPVYQAGTLSGHPLVMAAGQATLAQLDVSAYARLESLGTRLEAVLRAAGVPRVSRVGSLLTPFVRSTEEFALIHRRLRDAGVLAPPSQYEAWFISTAHEPADLDMVGAALA
ncbi:MAG TPA: glutamate-1-semialdehyde 2,1-aminomutase [Candidatus Nitrosotalea sp.]|nr:glutamate-1-semialdehyde 2,1-aminomutase [Candidatus Nitrosotalea sp.]